MLTLALLLCQDPAPAAPPASPEIQTILKACAKLAEAASYTVQQTTLDEGGGFGGPPPAAPAGGEGATPSVPPPPAPVIFTAQVQKGKPTRFTQDQLEAWREGEALVYRTGQEAWARLEPPRGGPGGGGQGGGQGGGNPQNQDPEAARSMRARMNLATAQVAHELLAGLDKKIAMAAASKDGAKTVITGSFTPEGASSLGRRFGRRGSGQGGGQGGAPAVENSGTFRCVVSADGTLESLVFDTLTKGTVNDAPYERKRHVELRVSAVGSTALEVPAEAAAKLAEKPRDPSKEF